MSNFTYPTTPDATIAVGDKVVSFDFPENVDHYIVGHVTHIIDDAYIIKGVGISREGKLRTTDKEFSVPVNGLDGMFGLTRGVMKI